MTFNALRHRALWGCNDRSHGTNPDCLLDNSKQAVMKSARNTSGISHTHHTFL